MIFYFQFVHYTDRELMDIKEFISNNFLNSKCHLISNNYFSKKFNITNTIGRYLYIDINDDNFNINNINNVLSLVSILKKTYSQLNLFIIQIKKLFISPLIFERFIVFLKSLNNNYITNFNLYVNVLNFNYSLLWSRINIFHLKFYIISMFFYVINFFSKKIIFI